MRRYMQEVREGELLGPIDWNYDFLPHFSGYCCSDEGKLQMCEQRKRLLAQIEADPTMWRVNTSGFWHQLLAVGMYDGWPFWKPTPALLVSGPIGAEWDFFYDLMDIERINT